MPSPGFLIVTTLVEETDAVKRLLHDISHVDDYWRGSVVAHDFRSRIQVAIAEIGESGNPGAQAVVGEAIKRLKPRYVILTGIAAGFPEAGVYEGDVLVPYQVVPYELAKLTPAGVSHRGLPLPVSYTLWYHAHTLARSDPPTWARKIGIPRPDGSVADPKVNVTPGSVLGSGEKVVADKGAEPRQWLLAEYKVRATGVDMESYGVAWACRTVDLPFLVIKAVQDAGTARKDEPGQKDLWRPYACAASAAFTVSLIETCGEIPPLTSTLLTDHLKAVAEHSRAFTELAPQPRFSYSVEWSGTYSKLKAGAVERVTTNVRDLVPNDLNPRIALHGAGGSGKSTLVKAVFTEGPGAGLCPVLFELRRYKTNRESVGDAKVVDSPFLLETFATTLPRRSPPELEQLAVSLRLLVILDGFNEIPKDAQKALIDHLNWLGGLGSCFVFVTDRLGQSDAIHAFTHLNVRPLDEELVRNSFEKEFGKDKYGSLNGRLREILKLPFFLDLAIKTKRTFSGVTLQTAIFHEFFTEQLQLDEVQLDHLASTAFKAFTVHGEFDYTSFERGLDGETRKLLSEAGVTRPDTRVFVHDLWRDYLVSRQLARPETPRTIDTLDQLTSFSSSIECVYLAMEQLGSREDKDDFLKKIYDWNYVAAAECITGSEASLEASAQPSQGTRYAILAAIADKRFDSIRNTRDRADRILKEHKYQEATPFQTCSDRDALIDHVRKLPAGEPWFESWRRLFTRRASDPMSSDEVEMMRSADSIIGWTASNVARRTHLTPHDIHWIRDTYRGAVADPSTGTVRWRLVHALGAHPSQETIDLLCEVLRADPYHWVRYGAARALMEIAAGPVVTLTDACLSCLISVVNAPDTADPWFQRRILREIFETAFTRHPPADWGNKVVPLLSAIIQHEGDQAYRGELQDRMSEFERIYRSAG